MNEPAVAEAERVESFEDFFHAHYERLLRTMYLTTGDRHEAEDLAQDAMTRIYERWDRVSGLDDPAGYVYRTALNLRHSRMRRLAVATRKALTATASPGPLDLVEERDSLRRALAALPIGQREAVVLLDWLEMTDDQAGKVLGVSAGAVRTRASRARATLRNVLRKDHDD